MSVKKPRLKLFSVFINVLIDLALIAAGVALYAIFKVYSFGAVGLSPLAIQIFGSQDLAVLVISGLLVLVGLFSLLRTLFRIIKR